MRTTASWLMALVIALAAPAAFAQIVTTFKTPPLADSDSFTLFLDTHIPGANPPWAGFSGALVRYHLLDAAELDVVAVHSPFTTVPLTPPGSANGPPLTGSVTVFSPFGPPSSNVTSVPFSFNLIGPFPASGSDVFTSSSFGLAAALIHAKGTTPANNSDVDAVIEIWQIYHKRLGFSSVTTFLTSQLLWVTSLGDTLVPDGLAGSTGHWTHIGGPIHLTGGSSAYVAVLATVVNLGIEHVPEPATGTLFAGGLVALAASRAARRRRLAS